MPCSRSLQPRRMWSSKAGTSFVAEKRESRLPRGFAFTGQARDGATSAPLVRTRNDRRGIPCSIAVLPEILERMLSCALLVKYFSNYFVIHFRCGCECGSAGTLACAGGAGGFVCFEHGVVVFGFGGAAAVARAVAFVGGGGIADDHFGAAGICGGMLGVGDFGSGAAAAVDFAGSFVRGAGECSAGAVHGTSERAAGALSDRSESGACVSAGIESDGDVVPARPRRGAGNFGRWIDAGFGGAASAEWIGRSGLAFGHFVDVGTDGAGRIFGGVRHARRAVSISARGVQSGADSGVVRKARSAAGYGGIPRAHVGAVRDVDVVRGVFRGRAARARRAAISAGCFVWRVCGDWSGRVWLLGRRAARGSVGTHADRSFGDGGFRCVCSGDWMGGAAGCRGAGYRCGVGNCRGGGFGAVFGDGDGAGGSGVRRDGAYCATGGGIYVDGGDDLAGAGAARPRRLARCVGDAGDRAGGRCCVHGAAEEFAGSRANRRGPRLKWLLVEVKFLRLFIFSKTDGCGVLAALR